MRAIIIALSLAIALPAAPAHANLFNFNLNPSRGQGCANEQLQRSVERSLPNLGQDVQFDRVSCHGLSQLHVLATGSLDRSDGQVRRRALAILRREGLVR